MANIESAPNENNDDWATITDSTDKPRSPKEHRDLIRDPFLQTPRLPQNVVTTEPLPEHKRDNVPSDDELFGDDPGWRTIIDNRRSE